MEEITAPRRSMVNPTHLRPNRRRSLSSSHGDPDRPQIPLSEFMTIMSIEVPQLDTYSVLSEELTSWIDGSKKICRQAQEDTSRVTPPLFYEFAMADETEKQDLLVSIQGYSVSICSFCPAIASAQAHQGELYRPSQVTVVRMEERMGRPAPAIRRRFVLRIRKRMFFLSLYDRHSSTKSRTPQDAKFLESVIGDAQSILPALRAEYAQVLEELEQEEAAVAELEKSDKDYLNELKVTIAEQEYVILILHMNIPPDLFFPIALKSRASVPMYPRLKPNSTV